MIKCIRGFSFLACIVLAAGVGRAAEVDRSGRVLPFHTLSRMATAPTIDGTISQDEWTSSGQFSPLKSGRSGIAEEFPQAVLVEYDDTAFYLAFRLHRPARAVTPLAPNQTGEAGTVAGDAVEIMFAPNLNYDASYSFWFYPNGAFGEATCSRNKNRNWSTAWQRAARVTDFGEGELSILPERYRLLKVWVEE